MSTAEYAKIRGTSSQAVTKAIRLGHKTPGLIRYETFGGSYILYVNPFKITKKKVKK